MPVRLPRTVLVTGLVVLGSVFALLTWQARTHPGPAAWDREVHSWVLGHRGGVVDVAFGAVTHLGTTAVLVPLLLVASVAVRLRRGTWRPGALALATYAAVVALHQAVATWVHRARPPARDWAAPAGGWSYTSGHTTQAWAGWLLLAVLAGLASGGPGRVVSRAVRRTIVVAAVLVASAVSLSRVWLGVHWPTDVLGGATSSLAVLCLVGLLVDVVPGNPGVTRSSRGGAAPAVR